MTQCPSGLSETDGSSSSHCWESTDHCLRDRLNEGPPQWIFQKLDHSSSGVFKLSLESADHQTEWQYISVYSEEEKLQVSGTLHGAFSSSWGAPVGLSMESNPVGYGLLVRKGPQRSYLVYMDACWNIKHSKSCAIKNSWVTVLIKKHALKALHLFVLTNMKEGVSTFDVHCGPAFLTSV